MFAIQKILTALLFIILYFQFVDAQRTMSKEDVLKIKNEEFVSFYCKNDICVRTDPLYDDKTVEIPDEHGNITTYIVDACNIKAAKENYCSSIECNTDSNCLSNKCVNKHCVHNKEEPMIRCDDIRAPGFLFFKGNLYMHCGKSWGDFCSSNDECSSNRCDEGCLQKAIDVHPGGNRITYIDIFGFYFLCILVAIFAMGLTICCCHFFIKKTKK
ncbi:hypothetical protein LY90DRAFT_628908 [Neocallimastix californiae]|jgi:hypothetical protein|uniref:Uncharacterized protein n=1 Tax=Neocallimastix californiae TaxID=1754190 RepID=A0A1Y2FR33_9FUNG|nr:hypothetical protein LY90DRAFT_628908 [Neocallimastix californiae]|eukprot:ORY86438.1 hypothetical protein LY90DRAFT_628908 [Neocallimastix californiae]